MLEFFYKNNKFILFVPSTIQIKPSNWRFKKDIANIIVENVELNQGVGYILDICSYVHLEIFIPKLQIVVEKSMQESSLTIHSSIWDYIDSRKLYLEERQKLGKGIIDEIPEVLTANDFEKFNIIMNNELVRDLRPKQRIASYHTAKMKRTMNFSVPGSGKTSMVYGAYAYLSSKEVNKVNKVVVIAPLNAARAWKEEFVSNFGEKRAITYMDIGKLDPVNAYLNVIDSEVNFVNYEKVSTLEDFLSEYIDNKTLLVLDEVHRIKNPNGIRAQSVIKATTNAGYITTLTGTPLPNKYVDLYNMMSILFKDDYSFFGYEKSELIEPSDYMKEMIKGQIEPFYFRVTKEQLQVPPRNDDLLHFSEQTDYEHDLFDIIKEKDISYLAKYVFLQQAEMIPQGASFLHPDSSLSPELFEDSVALNNKLSYEEKRLFQDAPISQKMLKTLDVIINLHNEGKPVVVWCNFRTTMNQLEKMLKQLNISCGQISGEVVSESRENILSKFKNGNLMVLITNPQTLAESVSLHDVCHDAVYCELNLNLAQFVQSKDRIHRLGLKPNQYTQNHFILARKHGKSFDAKTLEVLNTKERVMNEFLDKGNFDIKYYETTEEEIIKILESDVLD